MEGRRFTARKLLAEYRRGERDLRHAVLSGAGGLAGAVLSGAELWGAELGGADLTGASLVRAGLQRADLRRARLVRADLQGANLWRAQLGQADLTEARLDAAILDGADLADATLAGAQLLGTSLDQANLRGVNLSRAVLTRVGLTDADLAQADLSDTTLVDVVVPDSLADAATLDGAIVDWRTVARSLHQPDLVDLLVATGMPKLAATYLIDALHAIDAVDLTTMLLTVFLAHGPEATDVALALRTDLTGEGIRSWHVPGGPDLGRFDRMILCCTRPLLLRDGVLDHVKRALDREADGPIVVPVLLDDVLDDAGAPPDGWPTVHGETYRALRKRTRIDLRDVDRGGAVWWDRLEGLLAVLRPTRGR